MNIRVVCVDKMTFQVDAKTLKPLTTSTYDPWCFSQPESGDISHANWLDMVRLRDQKKNP